METKGSLPRSQELSTIPLLNHMNPVHALPLCLQSILILSSHLCLDLLSGFFPSGFTTRICTHFWSPLYVLHVPSISSSLVWLC
jgi:hypothetical protein